MGTGRNRKEVRGVAVIAAAFFCLSAWGFAQDAAVPSRGLEIISPQPDEVVASSTVDLFVDVSGLGIPTGQARVHAILNNDSPRRLADVRAPLTYRELPEGGHTLRVFATDADGRILRVPGAFATVHFFVREPDFQNFADPAGPMLTVNLPVDGPLTEAEASLDFVTHRAPLAAGSGYRLRYSLNGETHLHASGEPVLLHGLRPGRYELEVALVTAGGMAVPGPFNHVTRVFEIAAGPVEEPLAAAAPALPAFDPPAAPAALPDVLADAGPEAALTEPESRPPVRRRSLSSKPKRID